MCTGDFDLSEALNAPISYANGLADDWGNPPLETRHL